MLSIQNQIPVNIKYIPGKGFAVFTAETLQQAVVTGVIAYGDTPQQASRNYEILFC